MLEERNQVGKRKKERRTTVVASAMQREPASEKNWWGMMAPSPSTSGEMDPLEGGSDGSGGDRGTWHPPRSSFLSHTYAPFGPQ